MVTQMVRTVPNTRLFKIAINKEEGSGESADQVVHYIEHDADYVSEIRHSLPRGVDLVLDCQYEDNFQRDFDLLRPMGKYILFGTQAAINRGFFDSARSVSCIYITNFITDVSECTFMFAVVGPRKNFPFETIRGQQEHLWFQLAQSVVLPEGSSLHS
jgi:NADPH:quinone reductase-like Zn-dependent oxidoreductase